MEMKRHVKLYKSGKVWLAAAIFVVGVGAGVVNVPTISATPQIVRAATNDLVTTKDANGNVSIDPTNTAGSAVAITPSNAADYFTAASKAGISRTINGNTVQLTTGHESEDNDYKDGIVLMLANQQIDFKSDFSLNLTMNINYDGSTMNGWVPGDGTALFFQPLDAATSLSSARTGYYLGISDKSAADAVISFNISSNAMGKIHAGSTSYPSNQWIIYESNGSPVSAIDAPVDTGIAIPYGSSGSISYTYDMKYTAGTRTLTTVVSDGNGKALQTWNFKVPDSWSDTGYTMGVSASTALSHGAYQAVLNGYSYTPAGTTMSIQSIGLPAGTTGYTQTDIAAIAGNVVAFYPEGTTAPTTDASGQPVTTAIAVPAVGDYVLKQPQFLTVSTDDTKNVATLAFAKPSTVKVKYVDQNGNEIQNETTQSGYVGDQYSVTAPDISGYTYSKVADGSADLNGKYTDDSQTVTLAYNKKESTVSKPTESGDLTIKYVDQNGKEIQKSNVKKGYVGNGYGVTPSEIDGYTYQGLDKDSAALNGKFTTDPQTITLTYQQNRGEEVTPTTAGDLTIKYVDQNGKEIQESHVKNGYVGNAYGVTPSKIAGYTYQGLGTGSAALAGQFTADAQTITLVYQQNHGEETTPTAAGDLTIKYVDQNGKSIQADTVKSGCVGNSYGVTPSTIGGYTYQGLGTGSAALNGKFTTGAQIITLVYQQNHGEETTPTTAGNLTIKYVDQNGKSIQADTVKSGYVGNGYGVTPSTIDGYTYQGLGTGSAALNGKFTAGAQTITLVYQQNHGEETTPTAAGDLTIKYVDQNGKSIQADTVKSGYVGNGYGVTPSTIGGYTYQGLGTGSAALNGKFTAGDQTITLVYQQNHGEETTPTAAGDLTIKYVDQNGKSIRNDDVKSGYVGNGFGVTPSTIGGYTYQGLGTGSAALNGKFTAGAQTITLVYQQNHGEETTPTTAGNLTIKYVDQNGKSIQADTVKSGYVGNGYGVTPSTIGGYTYQGLGTGSAALNGTFTTSAQTITLVYQQNHGDETTPTAAGDLTIKYVDQNGKSIRNDDVKSGYVGNGYGVTPATINGYTYQSLGQDSAALSGKFTKNAQTITLVYRRDTTVPGKTTGTDTTKPHDGSSTKDNPTTSSSHVALPDTNGGTTASTAQKHQSLTDTNRDAKAATTQNRRTLPQTGEQTKRSTMIIGTLLLSMIGIIGIWKHQRKA